MKKLEILKENLTAAIETKKKHLQRPMDRKRLERKQEKREKEREEIKKIRCTLRGKKQ